MGKRVGKNLHLNEKLLPLVAVVRVQMQHEGKKTRQKIKGNPCQEYIAVLLLHLALEAAENRNVWK